MGDLAIGSHWDVINADLTSSYVEVTYGRAIRGFVVKARGEGNIRHKKLDADTKYVTIKGGTGHPFTVFLASSSSSLGFFATESGEDVLEGYVFY